MFLWAALHTTISQRYNRYNRYNRSTSSKNKDEKYKPYLWRSKSTILKNVPPCSSTGQQFVLQAWCRPSLPRKNNNNTVSAWCPPHPVHFHHVLTSGQMFPRFDNGESCCFRPFLSIFFTQRRRNQRPERIANAEKNKPTTATTT